MGNTGRHGMRLDGTIRSWNDERGFGFIEPTGGGQDVFFHVRTFRSRTGRPQAGQQVSFELESDDRGRPRAANVRAFQSSAPRPRPGSHHRVQRRLGALLAIPAFLVVYGVVAILWSPPPMAAAAYAGMSALAFLVYLLDKFAATRGSRRTPESTLLLLALAGGWPGALLAQQLLAHKTSKQGFRVAFWTVVLLNVAGFIVLASPAGADLLANL